MASSRYSELASAAKPHASSTSRAPGPARTRAIVTLESLTLRNLGSSGLSAGLRSSLMRTPKSLTAVSSVSGAVPADGRCEFCSASTARANIDIERVLLVTRHARVWYR